MANEIAKNEEKSLHRVRPATDIIEREDGFHVFMDIPGVRKEDLVIDLNDGELTVSGQTAPMGDGENYAEVQFGPVEYRRTLSVADVIDQERIKATLEHGVLELVLPKVEKVLPRRIEVRAG
jgi:HSP20 family molecular chaperone IbpA